MEIQITQIFQMKFKVNLIIPRIYFIQISSWNLLVILIKKLFHINRLVIMVQNKFHQIIISKIKKFKII
jgi:hypothetical protein